MSAIPSRMPTVDRLRRRTRTSHRNNEGVLTGSHRADDRASVREFEPKSPGSFYDPARSATAGYAATAGETWPDREKKCDNDRRRAGRGRSRGRWEEMTREASRRHRGPVARGLVQQVGTPHFGACCDGTRPPVFPDLSAPESCTGVVGLLLLLVSEEDEHPRRLPIPRANTTTKKTVLSMARLH